MQLVSHSVDVNVKIYILGVKECDRLSLKNFYPTFSGIWLVCKGYNFSSLFLQFLATNVSLSQCNSFTKL